MKKLIWELNKYGNIEVIKEGVVFTLLMTGEKMDNWNNIAKVQRIILDYAGEKYPVIEVVKNTKSYFIMILKPPTP